MRLNHKNLQMFENQLNENFEIDSDDDLYDEEDDNYNI